MISQLKHALLPIITLLFLGSPAVAAEDFDPISSGLRMLWGLLVVLAIILVLYGLLRKRITAFNTNDKGSIKILEVKQVLPKKSLMLVEIKGQEFVVGAGNETIDTIVPLRTQNTFSSILESTEEKQLS